MIMVLPASVATAINKLNYKTKYQELMDSLKLQLAPMMEYTD
jgi:hypothetical protein